MGFLGLASYTTENETKEIGVRKIFGASVGKVIYRFNLGFVKWIFISFIIASPLAWYILSDWLQNFQYRIDITFIDFTISLVVAILVAVLTATWQALVAAIRDTAKALCYE